MFDLKDEDFDVIESWGLKENPLKAIEDFSSEKLEKRWENPYQKEAHEEYYRKRQEYIEQENFDNYYKKAEKLIDFQKKTIMFLRSLFLKMSLLIQ